MYVDDDLVRVLGEALSREGCSCSLSRDELVESVRAVLLTLAESLPEFGDRLPMESIPETMPPPPGISLRDWRVIIYRVNEWENALARWQVSHLAVEELRKILRTRR